MTLDRSTLDSIVLRQQSLAQAARQGTARITGNGALLQELFGMLDDVQPTFDIVPSVPGSSARPPAPAAP